MLKCIVLFSPSFMFNNLQAYEAHRASLSSTISWSVHKLMCIESVMPPSSLILCHPLLHLPPIFPSHRVFPNESVLHIRWPYYWSFSFNIRLSKEYSGFPLGLTGLILLSKRLSRGFSSTTVQKHNSLALRLLGENHYTIQV